MVATSIRPVGLLRPPPMRPMSFLVNPKELRQPFDPLIKQLPSMYEDQCIDTPLSDHPGGNHRLAERRRCRKDSSVVFEQFSNSGLLFRSQVSLER